MSRRELESSHLGPWSTQAVYGCENLGVQENTIRRNQPHMTEQHTENPVDTEYSVTGKRVNYIAYSQQFHCLFQIKRSK